MNKDTFTYHYFYNGVRAQLVRYDTVVNGYECFDISDLTILGIPGGNLILKCEDFIFELPKSLNIITYTDDENCITETQIILKIIENLNLDL